MKKISVKDIKNGMSRNEMRVIKGGSGQGCSFYNPDCNTYEIKNLQNSNGYSCC